MFKRRDLVVKDIIGNDKAQVKYYGSIKLQDGSEKVLASYNDENILARKLYFSKRKDCYYFRVKAHVVHMSKSKEKLTKLI